MIQFQLNFNISVRFSFKKYNKMGFRLPSWILILAGLLCIAEGRYKCEVKDFIRLGNSCYFLSSEIVSWQEAHFRCRDRDAQLAVLATQYEDSTLRSYLERPEFAQLGRWIGGMWNEGWVWAAQGNEIENIRGFATTGVQNLPSTDAWMCLYMDPRYRYRWSNENCILQLHYICEAPLTKVLEEDDADGLITTPSGTNSIPTPQENSYNNLPFNNILEETTNHDMTTTPTIYTRPATRKNPPEEHSFAMLATTPKIAYTDDDDDSSDDTDLSESLENGDSGESDDSEDDEYNSQGRRFY